ncbi:MAG: PIN domain-containing protein [Aquincola tertiaricarbonis]|uniref:PIN domain-containing protein n=1 Tax=Aquincola tertiaricarbonis TaxID=391953 RepID=UPI000699212F|nr:type II toxin-antitoxin system VapC family toxin [Aquincola tertiaricarbonis]
MNAGIAIDTNVLVRWLVQDDPVQSASASRLMATAEERGLPVMLLFGVLLETEWVLRSRYKLDKHAIVSAFTQLLETDGLQLEDEAALEEALFRWKESKAGFTDCMLAAKAGLLQRQPFMTFDAAAAQLPGAQLLR